MSGEADLDKEHHRVIWRIARKQAQESELSIRMLENNQIKGLLPFDYYYIDDTLQFQYSYGSLQRVSEYFQEKKAGYDTVFMLCKGIIEIVDGGAEYLLEESGYCVMPEWIFWNHYEKKICLCYLPGKNETFKKEYTILVEYLMEHTDHSDKRAVELIYGLYHFITSENFVVKDILKYLKECKEQEEISVNSDSEAEKKESRQKRLSDSPYVLSRISGGKGVEDTGKDFLLPENSSYMVDKRESIVGREQKSDLYLPYQIISRRHAVLFYENRAVYVMDTDSRNGTYVNGNKISAYVKTECKTEDVLTFADISYRLQKRDGN